ncbi:exocyst complex component 3-like protein 4 [Hoplias malabaricus]|uniref:exocyst complex component 3-like protein 4 n=1 Tax=Hoplias malabaricus TaxID=27720 RepID=UPI003462BF9E
MASHSTCLRVMACFCSKSDADDDDKTKDDGELPTQENSEDSIQRMLPLKSGSRNSLSERTTGSRGFSCENFTQNIPVKPLTSVQIEELLNRGDLQEAYLNMLSLQREIQHEQDAPDEVSPLADLNNKENDLSLLYKALRTKITNIVQNSCDQTSKYLLKHAACIIQEEEKEKGGWRDAWRAAVRDGVRDTFKRVPLESKEQNTSWLPVHLGLLGKAVVEHLEKVKTEIVSLYPPSFNVFETYVSSCHEVMKEHLNGLLEKVTELKDYYAMLDFIINSYHSEKILGPEMECALTVPAVLVNQIKNKYCNCLQKDLHTFLDNVIQLEQKEVWLNHETPQTTDDEKFLTSHIHMDICTLIETYCQNSAKLDESLKKSVLCTCLETLTNFPKRFEEEFLKQNSSLLCSGPLDCCLWVKYHVAYINSFNFLKEKLEDFRDSCPDQVEQQRTELDGLVCRLSQALLQQFKTEIEPFMEKMMTKKWLKTNNGFKELTDKIEIYSGASRFMTSPPAESFVSDMHYHVVKEYISELLKRKYSCKGRKNELAAVKIEEQWDELRSLFSEMGSKLNWLYPLGAHLSEIIRQKKEKDIKNLLPSFLENYPDISEKQLSAILYFRERGFGQYIGNSVIRHFNDLKKKTVKKNHEHILFDKIK